MGSFGPVLGTEGGAGGSGFGGPSDHPNDYTGNANLSTTFGMLQGVANGTGPNPAMAQYNQNIQNIAKQQSGAISSVQGISPALAARMISQQGSAAMQNAAGQGATMQAQQQLGAMGQMGNVAGQQALIASGMQQNVNNVNAGLANQMGERGQSAAGGTMSGVGSAMAMAAGGMVQGGGGPVRMADGGEIGPISQFGQFLAGAVRDPGGASVNSLVPEVLHAPKEPTPNMNKKKPQQQPPQDMGTETQGTGQTFGSPAMYTQGNYGDNVMIAQSGPSVVDYSSGPQQAPSYGDQLMSSDTGMGDAGAAEGGAGEYAMGGMSRNYRSGGGVMASAPGQRAVAPGNSYANDKVPAVLSEGEIVLPRSVTQSRNPPAAAMRFVQAVMAKKVRK